MATFEQISTPDGGEARLYDDGDGVVAVGCERDTIPVHGQSLADALARLGYVARVSSMTTRHAGDGHT